MIKQSLFAAFLTLVICCLPLYGKEGRVTVHVVDEEGNSIPNIEVNADFNNAMAPGTGWGTGAPTVANAVTGKNGVCVLAGNGNLPSVDIGIMNSSSYYGNSTGVTFTNSLLGQWEPRNPTIEIVLQRVGIQVPMYAKKVWEAKIPGEGRSIGFDLMAGDWVAPDGNGQIPDLLFDFVKKTNGVVATGPRRTEHQLLDNSLVISFPNSGDGIQPVAATSGGLRLPREAPTNGYSATLMKREYTLATNVVDVISQTKFVRHSDFDRNANYFFRVRSKTDERGNVTNALYGKIYGDFNVDFRQGRIGFTYYLNPTPNSRNMEFDPKHNLFTNLPPVERVLAP